MSSYLKHRRVYWRIFRCVTRISATFHIFVEPVHCVAAVTTAAVISMICSFQTLQITLTIHHRLILSESREAS